MVFTTFLLLPHNPDIYQYGDSKIVFERKPRFFGQKLEIRISKCETMTEIKNVPMTKTFNFQWVRFDHFVIWYSNLFRISSFEFRIWPKHDFSFRH